jgi:ribonuclease J
MLRGARAAARSVSGGGELLFALGVERVDLLDEARDAVAKAVTQALRGGMRDVDALEREVRRAAGRFVGERTRRRPMIVPIVMEA